VSRLLPVYPNQQTFASSPRHVAYATKQAHEVRARFYTIGSLVVIILAFYVLAVAIF